MKLSVVIPTFNAANTLRGAVGSCYLQGLDDFEIIIVDNNSTDDTLAVARALQGEHKGIIVSSESKQGAAAARNHGARIASGEWLQFLDADDILLPGKWFRQLALVQKEQDWLIGAFIYRDVDGAETTVDVDEDPWRGIMYSGGIGCMHANLFRRTRYLEIGGMDENLVTMEDYNLYFRFLKAGCLYAIDPTPGCVYIRYPTPTLSTEDDKGRTATRVRLSIEVLAWIQVHCPGYWGRNEKVLKSWQFRHVRRQATFDLSAAAVNFKYAFPEGIPSGMLNYSIKKFEHILIYAFGFYPVEWFRNTSRKALKLLSRR